MAAGVKRPDALHIGPHRYAVKWDTAAIDAQRTKQDNANISGHIHYQNHVITIDPDCAPGHHRRALLHEVLHGILDVTGWNTHVPKNPDIDDFLVRIDSMLLDTLRRNPEFVAWLTAPAETGA